MQVEERHCGEGGCTAAAATTETAVALGWDIVENVLFCPLHKPEAARRELAKRETERMRAQIDKLRAERNAYRAKTTLNAVEYRQWDQFQSELADFHKKHGKLAPKALRLMDPKTFTEIMRARGKIDIEEESKALYEAEKTADATRDWLMRR